jgi:hypothetical protein
MAQDIAKICSFTIIFVNQFLTGNGGCENG